MSSSITKTADNSKEKKKIPKVKKKNILELHKEFLKLILKMAQNNLYSKWLFCHLFFCWRQGWWDDASQIFLL